MKLDATIVGKALDLAYDKAVDGVPGVPGMESAEGLAKDYLNDPGSLEDAVNALIRYQVVKATTSGFVTGLGGLLTLPVAIPANLASIMYLQLQMVAAIARMGGHDVRSDRVRAVCYACLCGNAATDILKGAGITIGKKLTEQAIKQLSFDVILKINRAVGFRLFTKFGQTGVINLGKAYLWWAESSAEPSTGRRPTPSAGWPRACSSPATTPQRSVPKRRTSTTTCPTGCSAKATMVAPAARTGSSGVRTTVSSPLSPINSAGGPVDSRTVGVDSGKYS